MPKTLALLVTAATLAAPVHAAPLEMSAGDVRPGAFAGVRLNVPLGGSKAARPRTELAIAPTLSPTSADGMTTTRIGEGVALTVGERHKPMLTIAGVRADTALGLRSEGQPNADHKLGLSTGWVIAGGVLVAAGVYFAIIYKEAVDNTE